MQDHRTQLATLIASRICHDLISPVGAISNGLELVSLGGGMSDGPEMSLISESCDNANARIRFFRVAFGTANDMAQVSALETRSILDAMTRGTRLQIVWPSDGDASRTDVQLAFLAIQCAEVALRRGGRIDISLAPNRVEIQASADTISIDPILWRHLDGPQATTRVLGEALDIAPAHVQFALLPLLAGDRARKPSYQATESDLTIVV
ncbi:histidine phosphotransferase family protein [Primorskyibacter sp. S187A]|uniref:histidine phosphotransferase family protein n=1 Tax=Primorskyibacter sp. S187A TaxID=3415130 RepID=UPI003C7D62AD